MRKYSCSGPQVAKTRSAVEPNSFRTRTARFERRAHAARWKARRVRLALDQFLAAELGDRGALTGWREKRIVLLGGDAGERLEPVRVMGRAVLDRPLFQGRRDRVSGRHIK